MDGGIQNSHLTTSSAGVGTTASGRFQKFSGQAYTGRRIGHQQRASKTGSMDKRLHATLGFTARNILKVQLHGLFADLWLASPESVLPEYCLCVCCLWSVCLLQS